VRRSSYCRTSWTVSSTSMGRSTCCTPRSLSTVRVEGHHLPGHQRVPRPTARRAVLGHACSAAYVPRRTGRGAAILERRLARLLRSCPAAVSQAGLRAPPLRLFGSVRLLAGRGMEVLGADGNACQAASRGGMGRPLRRTCGPLHHVGSAPPPESCPRPPSQRVCGHRRQPPPTERPRLHISTRP
jgi:hypothetical protein